MLLVFYFKMRILYGSCFRIRFWDVSTIHIEKFELFNVHILERYFLAELMIPKLQK
jgi:hypothetical protein